ncbi:hypothetical protein SAMN05444920_13472 [Nonomuraea solani]|uniref:Uncharacterized protein n=1 Tax=Nonomuraea solani TaxID=1144553 RepID=A0A1H6EZE2_9ACTN|nr:hypothetical protein [Nonomuraea solani]SEH03268.1 hypothetical protein SAMN05444920_13472 [Nonomuraea solani]
MAVDQPSEDLVTAVNAIKNLNEAERAQLADALARTAAEALTQLLRDEFLSAFTAKAAELGGLSDIGQLPNIRARRAFTFDSRNTLRQDRQINGQE